MLSIACFELCTALQNDQYVGFPAPESRIPFYADIYSKDSVNSLPYGSCFFVCNYLLSFIVISCVTIGMPKGVILTHGAIVSDVSAIHRHNVSCGYGVFMHR